MFFKTIKKHYKFYITMFIVMLFFITTLISVGFSALNQELNISGDIDYEDTTPLLYNVLKKAANVGTYAKEYTGSHQDSMAGVGSEKIYYWYASSGSDTNGTAITNMNNVIFADHCWQMIRTTDTGGVKMIYNGEPENNKCLDTRGNHVGFASKTSQSMSTTYYYGTSYIYDSTNGVFSLSGIVTTGTIQTGQYTCKQTTSTGTCATLYLVNTLSSGTTYQLLSLNGNSHYSQFGKLSFNSVMGSPAYAGYMYNTVYSYRYPSTPTETILSTASLSTTYWYGDSIRYKPSSNKYELANEYQVSDPTDYPNLVGKYTLRNATHGYASSTVYYIAAVNSSTMYYIQLQDSTNHNLADYNYTYTYGDSFTDNGNGTYTINNPTTVNRVDWYTSYTNIGANKYLCKNATNNTCSELWYTTSTSSGYIDYIKVADVYKYAKGFTYNDATSTYTLNNDSVSFWNITDSANQASINNAHYTCWNETGECTTLSYIYYMSGRTPYYINLTNGKSVNDAINEMLYNDDVNTTNSTIKIAVDGWYQNNMASYTSKLEDIIFCNDRSQINQATNGWNPDGGNATSNIYFKNYYSNSDLTCDNTTDKFSLTNSKAQLTYPVGLLTYPEANLLSNNNIRKTGQSYWTASPAYFLTYNAGGEIVGSGGSLVLSSTDQTSGVRPVISLKPGTEYVSGDGSKDDPYVVQ